MTRGSSARTSKASSTFLHRAARGGAALGVGQVLGTASTWLATMVLARVLTPQDFGLVGMAVVVLGFVNTFADLGLTAALIQRPQLDEAHKSAAFWSSLVVGVLLFVAIAALSPVLGAFYHEPRLPAVLVVAGLSLLLSPFWTTHAALLRRKLEFGAVARIEVLRNVASGIVSVSGALAGAGYWAITFGPIASHLTAIVAYRIAEVGFRPNPRGTRQHARDLFGFSIYVAGASTVNYLSANVDYLVIGRSLGVEALGLYMLAYQLITFPLGRISSLFSQVMFPAFSALQDKLDELRDAYLKINRSVALISCPILSWLAVAAPELISLIYGDTWLPAVLAVQILSIAGALKSVGTLVGLVFKSRGKPHVELYWNIFWAALLTVGALVGVRWGINGVAAAVSLLSLFGVVYTERLACRYLELPWQHLLRTLAPPFVSGVIATAAVFAFGVKLRDWLPGSGLVNALRLMILTVALAACYAGTVRVLIPGIASEARAFLAHFRKAA